MDVNHFYHYVNPSKKHKFAFLIISKSASQSIISYEQFKLQNNYIIPYCEYNNKVYCCLRNPLNRFISSIPETLTRYTLRHQYPNNFGQGIYINTNIKKVLDELIIILDKPILFLEQYLDLIEKFFFDTHHTPQVNFISDLNLNLLGSINFFLLDNFNEAIKIICEEYKLKFTQPEVENIYGLKLKEKSNLDNFKINFKNILLKYGIIHKNFRYPIENIYNKNLCLLDKAYKVWSKLILEESIKKRIYKLYQYDFMIYNYLKERKKVINNISQITFKKALGINK